MPDILLSTLGTTWQIVPELIGFTNPDVIDLYKFHPESSRIQESRRQYGIEPVDQVWLVTTDDPRTSAAVATLFDWYSQLVGRPAPAPALMVWQIEGISDLGSEWQCRCMAEAVMRLVLHAVSLSDGGKPTVSLAGGRKTMSSDIQNAATVFGCRALLHVIADDNHSKQMKDWGAACFLEPLPENLFSAVTPLVVEQYHREPLIVIDETLAPERYPLPAGCPGRPVRWSHGNGTWLLDEIQRRTATANYLYRNYSRNIVGGGAAANFLALYSLPPALVEKLKNCRIGIDPARTAKEIEWLRKLPKADLHCHLGGIADANETLDIAAANRASVEANKGRLDPWLKPLARLLHEDPAGMEAVFADLKKLREAVPGVPQPICAAAFTLLFEEQPECLDALLFGPLRDPGRYCGIGFDRYEACGDLQGSALLQSEAGLRAACRILVRNAARHNVTYLEVRCSPVKYTRGGLSGERVARIIDDELRRADLIHYGIVFIASRHGKMSEVYRHVELADELLHGGEFPALCGFDVAGNEKSRRAVELRDALLPMMARCLHLTIHAGESESAESIWEAVYHLNAERIGHGLTLRGNPSLLARFRDRRITLEMCPSSNLQVVGFRDHFLPGTHHRAVYPLQEYLQSGLKVTVNTDNPGISRTNPTTELHRAARMTPGGLSLWEILLLVRNGFKAAFTEPHTRQRLILAAEKKIVELVQQPLPGENR